MRIIRESRVKEFMRMHPKSRRMLERWIRLTRRARWAHLMHVRQTFPDADEAAVRSGNKAVVFDINGNDFRLICAVHYMQPLKSPELAGRWTEGRVYVFYFLTHSQYDTNAWKETL